MTSAKLRLASLLLVWSGLSTACGAEDALAVDPEDEPPAGPAFDAGATEEEGGTPKADVPDAATTEAGDADGGTKPKPEPDVDTIPWVSGGNTGFGVASKDTQNPTGNSAALIYGGYESTLTGVKGWTTALYRAELKARGVRHLFAIQGPATVQYTQKEIGNTNIIAALLPKVDAKTKFILVLGHSSGSYVAHEMLGQVAGGFDPDGKMKGKLVYFDLDGGRGGFTDAIATRMRKAYFVAPRDVAKGTLGFNNASMVSAGADYASLGGTLAFDASTAGCNAGARGCVHDALIIDRPHSPAGASPDRDYDDHSGGRKVMTRFLLEKGAEAGLVP